MSGVAEFEARVEEQSRVVALEHGFTDGERQQWIRLQMEMYLNPRLRKKVQRRQRRFARAARMSPTIKTKRRQ